MEVKSILNYRARRFSSFWKSRAYLTIGIVAFRRFGRLRLVWHRRRKNLCSSCRRYRLSRAKQKRNVDIAILGSAAVVSAAIIVTINGVCDDGGDGDGDDREDDSEAS